MNHIYFPFFLKAAIDVSFNITCRIKIFVGLRILDNIYKRVTKCLTNKDVYIKDVSGYQVASNDFTLLHAAIIEGISTRNA